MIKFIFTVCTILIFFQGCNEPPTDVEKIFITKLKVQYGNNYSFNAKHGIYLLVKAKGKVNLEDIKKIRISFVGDFPKIRWSYVNAYDSTGNFLYQLYYDRHTKKFSKSFKEFDF